VLHLDRKVNHHNVHAAIPHTTILNEQDLLKLNVLFHFSRKGLWPIFFRAKCDLDMMNGHFPQLDKNADSYIFQQDGVLLHFHYEVFHYLGESATSLDWMLCLQ
jgi:hypothetical protein